MNVAMLAEQETHRQRCTSDQQLSVMNTHCTNTTAIAIISGSNISKTIQYITAMFDGTKSTEFFITPQYTALEFQQNDKTNFVVSLF